MKNFNLILFVIAILFSACDYNGRNFPDYGNIPTDFKRLDYTLTAADYKTIADNKSNQATAEENGVLAELKALTTTKAFSPTLSAQKYVPALLASLFPTADKKSAIRVTYNYRYGSLAFYKLSVSDYTKIWGGVSTVGALTPSKSPNIVLSDLMDEKFSTAKEGDVKVVEYEYSAVEPNEVGFEPQTLFAYIKYSGGNWFFDNTKTIYQLTDDDYTAMGKPYLAAADAPNYLPILLKLKYPYAQQGDVKVVVYKTSATTENADEYVYKNEVWSPNSFIEPRTEQFIKRDDGKWVFDPSVSYKMVKADYQLMCDYVLNDPVLYVYKRGTYTNEEWYYGFNAYYDNISLRVSGSPTSSRDVPCSLENDTELHSLATDEEKAALLWKRLTEEGMIIYLQLKFPNTAAVVSGVTVDYHITAKVYYGPTSNDTKMYEFSYKTLTSGTATAPPTFEFIDALEL